MVCGTQVSPETRRLSLLVDIDAPPIERLDIVHIVTCLAANRRKYVRV